MRNCAFALVAGMAMFQCLPTLPRPIYYAAGAVFVMAFVAVRALRPLAFVVLGLLWAMWRADIVLDQRLAPALAGRVANLTARVIAPPDSFGVGIRLFVAAETLHDLRGRPLRPRRLLLNWYGANVSPTTGTRCVLKVRLEQARGALNPAGFDREKWLFRQRIGATANVLAHPSNTCSDSGGAVIGRAREFVRGALRERADTTSAAGIIAALTIADRRDLDDRTWSVLRDTGTAHLVAISGLHISFVAGAVFFAVRVLTGLCAPVARRWPAQHVAAVAAVLAAGAYAALAGLPVSAERALVMLALAMACVLARRPAVTADNFALAMAAVAVLDPLCLLGAAYWLSFGAVACLLLIDQTRRPAGTVRRVLRLHATLALGMTPLLGLLYQSVPLGSPLANLVAVPVVTFALVPCALGGAALLPFSPVAADVLWQAAAAIWTPLWAFLCWVAVHVPALPLPAAAPLPAIAVALLAVLAVLIPVIPGARILGVVMCAVLVIDRGSDLAPGSVRLTVLDVGQGLAAVIETTSQVLVYDTGAARGRYSAGADVIAPYLRARGRRVVDHLVVSHGDADHSGGWPGLAAELPVKHVTVSPGHVVATPVERCAAGQTWIRDEVAFRMLHPRSGTGGSDNDRSCVLQIIAPGGRILLPGDIEQAGERALVERFGERLRADIVIAPHHGSATSSSGPFIAAVAPRYVVFAAGYRNRFGFPKPEIVAAYRARGAATLATGERGAITFVLDERVHAPRGMRDHTRRYWRITTPAAAP